MSWVRSRSPAPLSPRELESFRVFPLPSMVVRSIIGRAPRARPRRPPQSGGEKLVLDLVETLRGGANAIELPIFSFGTVRTQVPNTFSSSSRQDQTSRPC